MGNCLISEQPTSCFTISEERLENNKIYKAYKVIKILSDDIQSKNILKTDKIYLIYIHTIQEFVNFIERISNFNDSSIAKLLEENSFKFNFDNLQIINEENFETKNEFLIVDEKFLQILGIQEIQFHNSSVILDIDKGKNIYLIEFANQTKKSFIKSNNLNFCYEFDPNIADLETTIIMRNNFENANDNNNTNTNNNGNSNYSNPINRIGFYNNYNP